jgi:hypothetical protein
MAAALSDLIQRVRLVIDQIGSNFLNDSEITQNINTSGIEMHDLCLRANEDHFTKTYAFTAGSAASYPMPADFYYLRMIEWSYGGRTYTLDTVDLINKNEFQQIGSIPSAYYLSQNSVYFLPGGAQGSMIAWYIPKYIELVLTTDEISNIYPKLSEEFMVISAALHCLRKLGEDVSSFAYEKDRLKAALGAANSDRNRGIPKGILNTNRVRRLGGNSIFSRKGRYS